MVMKMSLHQQRIIYNPNGMECFLLLHCITKIVVVIFEIHLTKTHHITILRLVFVCEDDTEQESCLFATFFLPAKIAKNLTINKLHFI